MHRLFLLLFVSQLAAFMPGAAADTPGETYDVVTPPAQVGDKWQFSSSGTSTHKFSNIVEGVRSVTDKRFAIELKGVVTNLELSKKQLATKISFDVERCVATVDGQPHTLFEKGDSVTIDSALEKNSQIVVNGKAFAGDADAITLLQIVLYPSTPEEETIDARFPPKGKRKVGDVWKVDREVDAAGWTKIGWTVDNENITGETKLVSVSQQNGERWLSLHQDYEAKALLPKDDPQSDVTPEPGNVRHSITLVVPATLPGKSLRAEGSAAANFRFKSRKDDGKSFRSEMTTNIAAKVQWERLEPKPKER